MTYFKVSKNASDEQSVTNKVFLNPTEWKAAKDKPARSLECQRGPCLAVDCSAAACISVSESRTTRSGTPSIPTGSPTGSSRGSRTGCATRARTIPIVNIFAAFLSRGFDHIRMGTVSQTDCNFVGSHVGVSIGEDWPSQMALEEMAMFRAVPGSTVFYRTNAVSTERAVELAANTKGFCSRRTSRPNTPVIYDNEDR